MWPFAIGRRATDRGATSTGRGPVGQSGQGETRRLAELNLQFAEQLERAERAEVSFVFFLGLERIWYEFVHFPNSFLVILLNWYFCFEKSGFRLDSPNWPERRRRQIQLQI